MSLSKVLSLALILAVARASPVLNNPSPVLRRDPPAPSTYPLGEACDHEWQYLNFNPDDDTDKAHLELLHYVICSREIRMMSILGQISAKDVLAPYKRYFPESDEEDDFQTHVKDVLGLIAGTSSPDELIGTVVGTFVVDNLDFAADDSNEADCNDEGTLAYTLTDRLDSREKIHFCDPSWTRGKADDVDCASLDPFPSTKMDSFSRIALHEMLHYSSVGPETSLAQQIIDVKNEDGEPAYDPPRVHGLIDPEQDENPAMPEINADSYAWMSLDAGISFKCMRDWGNSDWASFFSQNPPPYEAAE
ncbi:hypothetical protein EPUS_09184 [Endocarpon pusillum Z07020]|uniref:Lysine-specific metallo-endopeptidase domain-containing protein n=1 Tax=Endocarpon pusillum (strain Z07020 / HMAS-L-300199) TaxID=1263415 RepID=U1GVT8_ENDPU|nr:uncharacterized protein EPUS_09184 [Endocarpon pusillum Z07020]ERF76598.1 hypothetical protein EPUS_09184 [Endocarpon pusillum Z07020]